MFRLRDACAFGFLGMELVEGEGIRRERGEHRGKDLREVGRDPEHKHRPEAGHRWPAIQHT